MRSWRRPEGCQMSPISKLIAIQANVWREPVNFRDYRDQNLSSTRSTVPGLMAQLHHDPTSNFRGSDRHARSWRSPRSWFWPDCHHAALRSHVRLWLRLAVVGLFTTATSRCALQAQMPVVQQLGRRRALDAHRARSQHLRPTKARSVTGIAPGPYMAGGIGGASKGRSRC